MLPCKSEFGLAEAEGKVGRGSSNILAQQSRLITHQYP